MTRNTFKGSLQIRHVDAGSCNGCEAELSALLNPLYDLQQYGLDFVASPKHADAVTVSGPVTMAMQEPLQRAVAALSEPRLVIALGDCALGCGPFAQSYAVLGGLSNLLHPDLAIPGCPPPPDEILRALRRLQVGRPGPTA